MKLESINNTIMEKERKIEAPEWCEIEKVEIVDGVAVVTFREKKPKLPKSWEEFCDMFPVKDGECVINSSCIVAELNPSKELNFMGLIKAKRPLPTLGILPDRATAYAVLALCQLIQLRNAYNGDWVPNWDDGDEAKYTIEFRRGKLDTGVALKLSCSPLYFKSEEMRDLFLENFRPLIEKLKPLYGIKEGGEE